MRRNSTDPYSRHNKGTSRITDSNGTAYHRLGKNVSDLRLMSIEEAMIAGGLDFQVAKVPVHVLGQQTDWFATVNMETKNTLGMVKESYRVIQNSDAFSFFNPAIESGEAIIETVGTLGKNKEKTFILAKLPEEYKLGDVDTHRTYILITNDHSGNGNLIALPTDVRLACWNMYQSLMKSEKKMKTPMVKIRHSGDIKTKMQEAHKVLLVTREAMKMNQLFNEKLIRTPMTRELAGKMLDSLLNIKTEFGKSVEEVNSMVKVNQRDLLMRLFEGGIGADMFPNTAFNYLNAVTEWIDHKKSVKGGDLLSSVYVGGNGFRVKEQAVKQLADLVN